MPIPSRYSLHFTQIDCPYCGSQDACFINRLPVKRGCFACQKTWVQRGDQRVLVYDKKTGYHNLELNDEVEGVVRKAPEEKKRDRDERARKDNRVRRALTESGQVLKDDLR